MEQSISADICVVGLGASGLAAIEAAVERGLDTVGIDAGRVASGAAGRNGGFLLGGPSAFLHQAFKRWGESSVHLYRATLAELDRETEILGPDIISRVGSIRLAGMPGKARSNVEEAAREADLLDCSQHAQVLKTFSIAVEDYEGEFGRGIFIADDGAMNPARRALALATHVAPRARLFENSPALSIESGHVVTQCGSIRAPLILVAVDGKLETLLPQLAGHVRTARLQMLATAPIMPRRVPCPLYFRGGYDYAQQTRDGRLFVGGGRDQYIESEWTSDTDPTEPLQLWAQDLAERIIGRPVDVEDRWGASIACTSDGLPFCGEVEPGVFACGGYNGTGNLVGPVATRAALAAAIDNKSIPDYFTSKLPGRSPNHPEY